MSPSFAEFDRAQTRVEIQGLVSEACDSAVRLERARIRAELLGAFRPFSLDSNASVGTAENFVDILDRICPEEP